MGLLRPLRPGGAQHPIHASAGRKARRTGEEICWTKEALSKGRATPWLPRVEAAASHSPDHSAHYAWAADKEQGSEYYTIRAKDLATG